MSLAQPQQKAGNQCRIPATKKSFVSPYDLEAPAGAEGWRELYPYNLVFQESQKDQENGKFWFCDSQHWPNVFKPFETVGVEFAVRCLGAYNTRHYIIPPANGIEFRITQRLLLHEPRRGGT